MNDPNDNIIDNEIQGWVEVVDNEIQGWVDTIFGK